MLTIPAILQLDTITDYPLQNGYVVFGVPDVGVEVVRIDEAIPHALDLLYSMRRTDNLDGDVDVAGTFNCIHDGHKELLRTAIKLCEEKKYLSVGLTSDEFMMKTRTNGRKYQDRFDGLVNFFKSEGFDRYSIYPIHQNKVCFGCSCSTLVCSTETLNNAYELNEYQRRCTTNDRPD